MIIRGLLSKLGNLYLYHIYVYLIEAGEEDEVPAWFVEAYREQQLVDEYLRR